MGNPSDTDIIVRTSQVELIERLRHRVGGMIDKRPSRRTIVDMALIAFDGSLDAGFSVGDHLTQRTHRPHGGRKKKVHAKVGRSRAAPCNAGDASP